MPEQVNLQCETGMSRTGLPVCQDEVSCRMFLCARCRMRVLVCRRCDRGQIYCMGSCARDARREGQRNARRRNQATPRGRAMHAERSRRYRARVGRVTDHGPDPEPETDLLGERDSTVDRSEPTPAGTSPGRSRCHHCGRPVSPFVRLAGLRSRRRRVMRNQIARLARPP